MNPSPYRAPFKSAHLRATIVKILLIVGAAAAGLSLLADALSLAFPPLAEDQELADNPLGAILVFIILLLSFLELIIYVTTVVFFSIWLYRAADNVRAFDTWRRLKHSPGWAVGSFFIPFLNLVVPYRAVKEVWQESGPPGERHLSATNPPAFFPVWWLFWLLASFAGNASFRASFNENIPESTATIISAVAGGLAIVAAMFAYLVVDSIDKKQEETAATLRLGQPPGPPGPPADLLMRDAVEPAFSPATSQQS